VGRCEKAVSVSTRCTQQQQQQHGSVGCAGQATGELEAFFFLGSSSDGRT
jgi:hypothetical protein